MTGERDEITRILEGCARGENGADELLELVYGQLREIARLRLAGEAPGHSLQATALVHEAYLRLLGDDELDYRNRAHFFAAAAEAMRRILVDHARRKGSQKRGGGGRRLPIDLLDLAVEADPEGILALDEALDRLGREDAQAAAVVKLRFFAGLEVTETARQLGISERSVARDWAFARARLFALLDEG